MLGFTFNGVHSSAFGVVHTVDRPGMPKAKTDFVSRMNVDGSDDFTASLKGKPLYEDRVFTVQLQVKTTNTKSAIAKWLMVPGWLSFDDEPDKYWMAKCYGGLSFVPKLYGRYVEYDIEFRVEPFAYGAPETYSDGTLTLQAGTYYSDYLVITTQGTLSVHKNQNNGDMFGISKAMDFEITSSSVGTMVVDFHNHTIKDGNGNYPGRIEMNSDSEWIYLDDVTSTITVDGADTDGIIYRKCYI